MISSIVVNAQQEAQFTQFMYNQLNLNPAYAGARGMPSFTLLYRNQWVGFEGSPQSKLLSFNSPIFGNRVGFGLTIHNQTIGIFNNWKTSMAYSYHIKLNEESSIRFGLQGSMRYYGIDFSDPSVVVRDPTDQSISFDQKYDQYTGNFGVGIYMQLKQMYFGIGAPAFFPNELGINNNTLVPRIAEESSHYYLMAGTLLPLNDKIQLKPAFLGKYVKDAPFNADLNISMIFDQIFTAGLSYRLGGNGSGDSVDLLALYQINNVAIGAAYDFPLSEVKEVSGGSIEVMLRYDFIKERADMANPRFFF